MSVTTYIHLDSTYRNRGMYPQPADFIATFGKPTPIGVGAIGALGPISDAMPQYEFTGQAGDRALETFNGGTYINPVLNVLASSVDDFYNGYYITDTVLGEVRKIIGYSGSSQTLTLENPFSAAWAVGDTYTIDDQSTPLIVQMQYDASAVDNTYNGLLLRDETIDEYRLIVSYDGNTRTATLGSPFSGAWAVGDTYTIRGAPSEEEGAIVAATATTVTLPLTSSARDGYYTGKFVYIGSGAAYGYVGIITAYDGDTRTLRTTPAIAPLPMAGDEYEILPYSRDGVNAVRYTGSTLSQQEYANYEMQLLSINVPNLPITVSGGNRLAFYPYIQVTLCNASLAGSGSNILYTNNPNAFQSTFIVSVTDVSQPLTAQFLSLSSNGMVQTMRFKPNDDILMRVRLPDGSVFSVGDDTVAPLAPNPGMQISAVVSLRRL